MSLQCFQYTSPGKQLIKWRENSAGKEFRKAEDPDLREKEYKKMQECLPNKLETKEINKQRTIQQKEINSQIAWEKNIRDPEILNVKHYAKKNIE